MGQRARDDGVEPLGISGRNARVALDVALHDAGEEHREPIAGHRQRRGEQVESVAPSE